MGIRCMSISHDCVYLGCSNHAVYGHCETCDNYCFTHMMENVKEDNFGRSWKAAGYYKERCRRRLYGAKKHNELVDKELERLEAKKAEKNRRG